MNETEYVQNQLNNSSENKLSEIVNNLKENKRIIFTKFGDGEFLCMSNHNGRNCDGDTYTSELGSNLIKSFNELCYLSKTDNVYIGRWGNNNIIEYYIKIFYKYLKNNNYDLMNIPYVDYHTCYNSYYNFDKKDLYNFVETIQQSNKFKIVISNEYNIKLSKIFKSNTFVRIPSNSWYANNLYNQLYEAVDNKLNDNNDGIVIIAGGLGSKVLINDLCKKYKNASFIDIGSGFDLLATRKLTRMNGNDECSYNGEYNYYKNLLSDEFI